MKDNFKIAGLALLFTLVGVYGFHSVPNQAYAESFIAAMLGVFMTSATAKEKFINKTVMPEKAFKVLVVCVLSGLSFFMLIPVMITTGWTGIAITTALMILPTRNKKQ